MFERIGFQELLLILIIALVIFGPKKIPEMGKAIGQGLREFRNATRGLAEEIDKAQHDDQTAPNLGRESVR